MKSDTRKDAKAKRPIPSSGIGHRISEMAKLTGDRKTAASIAGVSPDTLQRYIRNEVQPSFEPIARLAEKAGVRLDWVATGEEPRLRSEAEAQRFDVETLEQAVLVLETRLAAKRGTMTAEGKAEMIASIYQLLINEGGDEKSRARLILRLLSMDK